MSAAIESVLRDQVDGAFLDDDNHDGVDIQQAGASKSREGKGPEKTISCVSCRKRKLKCDRIKPKCGTCSRLRHECEYPERRRNLGSKRRNMKELEARLGMAHVLQATDWQWLICYSSGRDSTCQRAEIGQCTTSLCHEHEHGCRLEYIGNGRGSEFRYKQCRLRHPTPWDAK